MSDSFLTRLRDRTETAQPTVIRQYDNLVRVYQVLRERQKEIDAAFDKVATQIGYLVTTTLPVRLEVGDQGSVKKAFFDSDALRGTIFEKELSPFLQDLGKKPLNSVDAGTYRLYLIWHDALKLKLQLNWVEIVSLRPIATIFPPHPNEYTQWFDPGMAIAIEDAVVILAMNEAYPDLGIVERISSNRLAIAQMRLPHAQEKPAYLEQRFGGKEREVLTEVRAMLDKQRG